MYTHKKSPKKVPENKMMEWNIEKYQSSGKEYSYHKDQKIKQKNRTLDKQTMKKE
jgi:hypothetical protein